MVFNQNNRISLVDLILLLGKNPNRISDDLFKDIVSIVLVITDIKKSYWANLKYPQANTNELSRRYGVQIFELNHEPLFTRLKHIPHLQWNDHKKIGKLLGYLTPVDLDEPGERLSFSVNVIRTDGKISKFLEQKIVVGAISISKITQYFHRAFDILNNWIEYPPRFQVKYIQPQLCFDIEFPVEK